jgi:beta-glucosidase/6-phospho-beta-glucosidase/beta-galactosidase
MFMSAYDNPHGDGDRSAFMSHHVEDHALAQQAEIRTVTGNTHGPFDSFLMGGFEGSTHRRADGRQLDMIAGTRHDEMALQDYRMLALAGIRTVRDAIRWHLVETTPGRYDWSSLLPMLRAAQQSGTQVIWDLCHYGLPHDIDIWSKAFPDRFAAFSAAAAHLLREESDGTPVYCPVNEVSFWAWAGGDHAQMYPAALGRGPELKRQLARAAIRAIDAVREVAPDARFVQAEPLIHVVPNPDMPETASGAEQHRRAQFEAFDMIAGRLAPELGGSEAHLDIVGVNYYSDNQMMRSGTTLPMGHPLYRPLRRLLGEVDARYGRPILISETGAEGGNAAGWLRYVGGEVRAAQRAGVSVQGICLYPVLDYPGWKDGRHCRCGLLRSDGDWRGRELDMDLMDQVTEEHVLMRMASGGAVPPVEQPLGEA